MKQAQEQIINHEIVKISDGELLTKALMFADTGKFFKGEKIVLSDADANSFYYVRQGAVEVSYTVRETRITVAMIGAGNFLGEIGFLDNGSRVRDIRVMEDTELKIFSSDVMAAFLETDPMLYGSFLAYLTRSICGKFRRIFDEREPLQAYGASLSTGKKSYNEAVMLPAKFQKTEEWKKINKLTENFKAQLYNLSNSLQQIQDEKVPDLLRKKGFNIFDQFYEKLTTLAKTEKKSDINIWGYVFKEIFPYLMRSHFAERAYYKPKSYAGDFIMMEMLYNNLPSGDGKLGCLIDEWLLNTPAAKAVRGRRILLKNKLLQLAGQQKESGKDISIMNLACGSCRELFDFLSDFDRTNLLNILCIDADTEALQFANKQVNNFNHQASIRFMNENIVKWSLGKRKHYFKKQDIIYSSGLTDYLEDKLFIRFVDTCYEHLTPGGTLMIGNFSPVNPTKVLMDYLLSWRLIHRSEKNMKKLFKKTSFQENVHIIAEDQQVNLFAVAKK